jgi:hypothetical protein
MKANDGQGTMSQHLPINAIAKGGTRCPEFLKLMRHLIVIRSAWAMSVR